MEGSKLDSYTALYLSLSALFDEEQACESPQHSTRPEDHAGAAEWYVHVKHAECGHDEVRAFCDKIKRVLDDPLTIARCGTCGVELPASEAVKSTTRMGA